MSDAYEFDRAYIDAERDALERELAEERESERVIRESELESVYNDLLQRAKNAPTGSIADERLDAQLCLLEELLELVEGS